MSLSKNIQTNQMAVKRRKNTFMRETWRRLKKNKMAVGGLVAILIIAFLAIFAPYIMPYDYAKQNYDERFLFPSIEHWLGTDNFGRDIFSRIIYGGRYTFFIGIVCTTVGAAVGILIGLCAAFYSKLDNILMRSIDILMGIPQLLLCVSIIAALGSSMKNMMIALSIVSIPDFARITRAQVLTIREQEYIEAARSIGAGDLRIMFKHIIPNSVAPILVQFTFRVADVILTGATLSFLGMGVQPPTPEWGLMVSAGRVYLRDYWYICIFPGLAIAINSFGLNLLGDGLRDALDPRLKQ